MIKLNRNQYSHNCIELLISQLEQMKANNITIEQFNQMLKNVDKLHRIQLETIELEDELNIPYWNGTKYVE